MLLALTSGGGRCHGVRCASRAKPLKFFLSPVGHLGDSAWAPFLDALPRFRRGTESGMVGRVHLVCVPARALQPPAPGDPESGREGGGACGYYTECRVVLGSSGGWRPCVLNITQVLSGFL